jgi:hypothetical protein
LHFVSLKQSLWLLQYGQKRKYGADADYLCQRSEGQQDDQLTPTLMGDMLPQCQQQFRQRFAIQHAILKMFGRNSTTAFDPL